MMGFNMRAGMKAWLAAVSSAAFSIAVTTPAWASCEASDLWGADDFPTPEVASTVDRLHFLAPQSAETPNCPSLSEECRLPAYLVAGDEVLITEFGSEGLACAHYISATGKVSSGWLDKSKLAAYGDDVVAFDSPEAYGEWVNALYDSTITISPSAEGEGAYVLVEGDASRGPPSYNMGAFGGPAYMSDNNRLAGYEDVHYGGEEPASAPRTPMDSCRIRFRFAGHYLHVDDNNLCGGHGVTFSGVYAKTQP
jgi:hypothetical protein